MTGNQKTCMLFFEVFCDFQFSSSLSTHFTNLCPKCLFHMNNHKDPDGLVISVEIISRWTEPQGNIYENGTRFFLVFLCSSFPILDNFYKTLGWNKWAVFFTKNQGVTHGEKILLTKSYNTYDIVSKCMSLNNWQTWCSRGCPTNSLVID